MAENPISIEAFAEWAKSMPADEEYNYFDSEHCACAQYAKAIGVAYPLGPLAFGFEELASLQPRTFGALAERLTARLRQHMETKP